MSAILVIFTLLLAVEIDGATLTTLFYFQGTNGSNPYSRLLLGVDGNFYGTTASGGIGYGTMSPPSGNGTIYRISPGGTFELLHSFAGIPDAVDPYAGLIWGPDGNYYGTTFAGGTTGLGIIYCMTSNGVVTIVKTFDSTDGYETLAPLCLGMDGSFYGTTFYGGSSGYGTVFRLQTNGVLTTLCSFPNPENHSFSPNAGLVQGADGYLYGTTYGAVGDNGTIFKISTNGELTTLVSFGGFTNGSHPHAEMIFGQDGSLYGTTSGVYPNENGTVFKVTTNGVLTNLISFGMTNGANPETPLVFGNDGDLYGTTANGGPNGGTGTVFRIQADGSLVTCFSFHGTNGANPYGLTQGPDGDFYGTTAFGGIDKNGTIFRLSIRPIIQSVTSSNGQINLSWSADSNVSYQVQYKTNLLQSQWSNLAVILATNTSMNLTDFMTSASSRYYRVGLLP